MTARCGSRILQARVAHNYGGARREGHMNTHQDFQANHSAQGSAVGIESRRKACQELATAPLGMERVHPSETLELNKVFGHAACYLSCHPNGFSPRDCQARTRAATRWSLPRSGVSDSECSGWRLWPIGRFGGLLQELNLDSSTTSRGSWGIWILRSRQRGVCSRGGSRQRN